MSVMINAPKIRHHMRINNISVSTIANSVGVDRRTITTYLDTGIVKKEELLEPIAKALNVSADWLLSEVMASDGEPGFFAVGNTGSVRPNLREYYTPVKLLSARAQMGMPIMTHETFNLTWLEETYPVFMPTIALSEKHLVIEVVGDSMVPEIKDRALVLAEAVNTNDIKYQSGGVFAVLYAGNHFVVKRIKSNSLNVNSTLTLWSDNERYGHIIIHGEDIIHMWKVIEKVKEPVR